LSFGVLAVSAALCVAAGFWVDSVTAEKRVVGWVLFGLAIVGFLAFIMLLVRNNDDYQPPF
jgi:hypothetical protein